LEGLTGEFAARQSELAEKTSGF
jgi:DNA repair protein SbcC/Rad50